MECTKVNCPMQAGTPTDNCGENCPWRTTAKTGDLISRAAAIDVFMGKPPDFYHTSYIVGEINCLPSVEALPVVHARWKDNGNETVSCSRCATWFPKEREPYLLYCGCCGAKMDGERRDGE